jgi:hypothetical protein
VVFDDGAKVAADYYDNVELKQSDPEVSNRVVLMSSLFLVCLPSIETSLRA